MVGIEILVITEGGKEYNEQLESGSLMLLLTRLPRRLNNIVKRVENGGKRIFEQQVTFKGDWNFLVLNRFTKGLDKRGVKWTWELNQS